MKTPKQDDVVSELSLSLSSDGDYKKLNKNFDKHKKLWKIEKQTIEQTKGIK